MPAPRPDRTATRLATGLLAACSLLYAWFALARGGIALKGKSGRIAFVDGVAGLAVAAGALLVATLGLVLLLQSLGAGRRVRLAAVALVWLPPLVFVLVRA